MKLEDATVRQEAETVAESAAMVVAGHGGESTRRFLPAVLGAVPVAVLMVDVRNGSVVYANPAAVVLAGNVRLPVSLDEWGVAAGLADLSGQPLAGSANPLSVLVTGRAVAGEAVRLNGLGATGDAGRTLWVTGFPLTEVGADESLALSVFLDVELNEGGQTPPDTLEAIRERAVIATDLSFTITDPRKPDNPLVWVNPAFTRTTGYPAEEAIGRNCRFLQGRATDPDSVARVREILTSGETGTVTLLNYRKDGSAFWNQLAISPVLDAEGQLVSFVGIQTDVTERVRTDGERDAALAAERTARRQIERARQRLGILVEATTQLNSTLDTHEALERLAATVVPALADWTLINLTDGDGRLSTAATRHRNGRDRALNRLVELQPEVLDDTSKVRRLLAGAAPFLLEEVTPATLIAEGASGLPDLVETLTELGAASAMFVPLTARHQHVLGTMVLVSSSPDHRFGPDDLEVAADLGRRAGLALDNARLYQQEHRVAETLQHSMLPVVPEVPGIAIAAEYLPSSAAAEVGGDFYEVIALPDGAIGVAVGDVVGHDLTAAAAMVHMRGLLRASAWDDAGPGGRRDPAEVVARVDRLVQGLDMVPMTTMVYGRLERPASTEQPWVLTYASAGHPPALLRLRSGEVVRLDAADGLLLGVGLDDGAARTSGRIEMPVGSTLVAYTDGLIERRDSDLETGISKLAAVLARTDGDLDALVTTVVASMGGNREDDVAVLALRVLDPEACGSARR